MAVTNNAVTFIGNLTDDPDLRFTQGGTAVVNLRVASNERYTRDGETSEVTTFMNVVAWREFAENVAESLNKGDRVVVVGKLSVRSYEKDGQTRWVTEIQADEVSPSLRYATASVSRNERESSSRGRAKAEPEPEMPF